MLTENDCYLASKEEQDKLVETVLAGGKLNRKCVGRDAKTLLSMIGVQAPANTRCIIFEGPKEHPLITTELTIPRIGIISSVVMSGCSFGPSKIMQRVFAGA